MKNPIAAAVAAACMGLAACTGGMAVVAPTPPPKYEKLGHAEGSACGSLLLAATAYNFIPLELNDRTGRAYSDAVGSVNGATGLIDVTLQENWYWWVLGSTRCVKIEGEAIK